MGDGDQPGRAGAGPEVGRIGPTISGASSAGSDRDTVSFREGARIDGSLDMDLGLGGHVAIITGPVKGMGGRITGAFAAEGCRLVLLGRDVAAIDPVAEATRHGG